MKKIILRNKWLLEEFPETKEEQLNYNSCFRYSDFYIKMINGYPLQILDFLLDLLYKGPDKFPVLIGNKTEFFEEGRILVFNIPVIKELWKILCIPENEYIKSLLILDKLNIMKTSIFNFTYDDEEQFSFLFNKIPKNISEEMDIKFCILNIDLIKDTLNFTENKDSKIFYDILNRYSEISNECDDKTYKCFPNVECFWKNNINYEKFYSK